MHATGMKRHSPNRNNSGTETTLHAQMYLRSALYYRKDSNVRSYVP